MTYREAAHLANDSIDLDSKKGARDLAILRVLYNTGARVQEVCSLRAKDIRVISPYMATLHGKGNKVRQVPLWKETVEALRPVLEGKESLDSIFCTRGEPLTRFGIRYIVKKYSSLAEKECPTIKEKKVGPHTFRHTTAMHLLQSGTDISVIKSWLGHVDLNTTHSYVEIDMEMKRDAISKLAGQSQSKKINKLLDRNKDVVEWLSNFK